MPQQGPLAGGPDAAHSVQDRCGHRLIATVAMERDREAVCLVADPLERPERLGVAPEQHRRRAPRHEDLLDPLREADHRDTALGQRLEDPDARRKQPACCLPLRPWHWGVPFGWARVTGRRTPPKPLLCPPATSGGWAAFRA